MDMTIDPAPASRADASINQEDALKYWNSVSSDVNGMLGGFPQTTRIDLQGSSNFLIKLRRGTQRGVKQPLPLLKRVADCGAGIGRITKALLFGVAEQVDVVEPVKKFTDEFVASLTPEESQKLGEVKNLGLQDWVPEKEAYDLIWNQWCLGHLTDEQLVAYLRRCKDGIRGKGSTDSEPCNSWIVVKENMSTNIYGNDIYDPEDSSVTRSDTNFRKLFQEAGLKIVATQEQKGFPKDLYPVRMYALKPE
jgi:protein N-terminal methyltransferase